jgi:O-antigen/teichoic acid export membrane protein
MLNKLKSLGKQTAVYGAGSILNKMLGFALIPMYLKYVPIGSFGNLVYLETIIIFLSAFLNLGIGPAIQRFYLNEREQNTHGIFLFNNFFGCLILALLAITPVLLFSGTLSQILCKNAAQSVLFRISMWTVLVEVLYALPLYVLQFEEKPFQYLFYNVIKLCLGFGITILMVVHFSMGIEGVFMARLIAGGIALALTVGFVILPRCKFVLDISSVVKSIRFGFPMVVSNLGNTLYVLSDRVMLNWLGTEEMVGKYGFGLRIANFINLIFVQTIGMSYMPSIMSDESKAGNLRYYRKMLTYYCFLMAVLILGFLFFYRDALVIVGNNKEYWEGLKVVPVLALSFMIIGMNIFLGVGLFLKNQTKYYIIPTFSAVLVNIGLDFILIPACGIIGAAYSVVAAQIVYTGLLAWFSSKQMAIGFEWGKIMLIYFFAIVIFGVNQFLNIPNFWIASAVKLLLIAAFPYILYKFNFFEAIEMESLKKALNKLVAKYRKTTTDVN